MAVVAAPGMSLPSIQHSPSYLSRIRGVDLFAGEQVDLVLHTDDGLIPEPAGAGQLLALTDRRLIHVADAPAARTRQMFPLSSVAGVGVVDRDRRSLSWKQQAWLIGGGAALYFAIAYWAVDRLPYFNVPLINIHPFALLLLIVMLALGWLFWRSMTQTAGTTLQIYGVNWSLDVSGTADYRDLLAFAQALLDAIPKPETAALLPQLTEGE